MEDSNVPSKLILSSSISVDISIPVLNSQHTRLSPENDSFTLRYHEGRFSSQSLINSKSTQVFPSGTVPSSFHASLHASSSISAARARSYTPPASYADTYTNAATLNQSLKHPNVNNTYQLFSSLRTCHIDILKRMTHSDTFRTYQRRNPYPSQTPSCKHKWTIPC